MLRMSVDNYCHTVDEVISNLVDGFKVIFPGPDELFLDIDSEEAYDRYRSMYFLLSSLLQPHDGLRRLETVSKSGLPNRHIRITLPGEMTMEQRFIFQLALGSDPELTTLREQVKVLREALEWLVNEMDCRDDEFGCCFSRSDFGRVRDALEQTKPKDGE